MSDYLIKNPKSLITLLEQSGVGDIPELQRASNTQEFHNQALLLSNPEGVVEKITKYLILKHFYDHAGLKIGPYSTSIKASIKDILGKNPAHESIFIQRRAELKFTTRTWTERTRKIQLSIMGLSIVYIIWSYLTEPEMWIMTHHFGFPIGLIVFPGLILSFILPHFFNEKEFENIKSLEELVDEIFIINQDKIRENHYAYFKEQLQ